MTLCKKIPALSILCVIVSLLASGAGHAANSLPFRARPHLTAKKEALAGQSRAVSEAGLEEVLSRENSSRLTGYHKKQEKNERVRKRALTPVLERYVTGGVMTFAW
jgi:hypothetical protein